MFEDRGRVFFTSQGTVDLGRRVFVTTGHQLGELRIIDNY